MEFGDSSEVVAMKNLSLNPRRSFDPSELPDLDEIYRGLDFCIEIGARDGNPNPSPLDSHQVDRKRELWCDLAIAALNYYNASQGTVFELYSRPVVAYPLDFSGYSCVHMNFEAKSKEGLDLSPERFFAEVWQFSDGPRVAVCKMLDPCSDLLKGCDICPSTVLHPKGLRFVRHPLKKARRRVITAGVCPACKKVQASNEQADSSGLQACGVML